MQSVVFTTYRLTTQRKSEEKNTSLIQDLLIRRQAGLEDVGSSDLTIDDIKGIAVAVFAAGQDTTWASLLVFIFNMVANPEVQSKAQKIIEGVVGPERLPTFEDRPKLLYTEYLVQETLRWCPVSPIGLPHRSLKDDIYRGIFIPKGSLLYVNAKAMTHDERLYRHPKKFEPERYIPLEEGGRGEPYPKGQFGFGRRICVGQHLAEASMWILMVALLAKFDIQKSIDDDRNEITPKLKLSNGLTSLPEGFPCRFVRRSDRSNCEQEGLGIMIKAFFALFY